MFAARVDANDRSCRISRNAKPTAHVEAAWESSNVNDSPPPSAEGDVDYRAVPPPFGHLHPAERRVAWAVVRTLATSAWWAGTVVTFAWLVLSGMNHSFEPIHGLPGLATLVAAGVLEYHADALGAKTT